MTTQPSEERVEARLEVLPGNIREALFSVAVMKIGEDIGLSKGLKDEDIPYLAEVVAWVMMAFLHPSGAAQAIQEYVGVPAETAKAIAQELDVKLFSKYKADLEKLYAPTVGEAPAKMMDVGPAAPAAATPKPVPIMISANTPIAPIPIPMTGPAPRITLSAPASASAPLKPAVSSLTPTINPVTVAPAPKPVPATTPTPGGPAPFILHQESTAAPLAPGTNFRLNLSSSMFKSTPASPTTNMPQPPKPAELEIGKAPFPQRPATTSPIHVEAPSTSRVVHYTDLKTIVAPTFGAAIPATPATPATPSIPTTPAPMRMPVQMPQPVSAPIMPTQPPAQAPAGPPKVVNFGPEEVK